MKLDKQAKKDFEKWLLIWLKEKVAFGNENPTWRDVKHFFRFPTPMQFGVIVDWADSVGLEINIHSASYEWAKDIWHWSIKNSDDEELIKYEEGLKSRQEARDDVIEKLNEIYNK